MNVYVLLVVSIFILFILSRYTIQTLYHFLSLFIRSQKFVFILMSFFYLPGTIIHEVSHALMAILLLLKVRSISFFPEFKGNSIKLGHVIYEKKDGFRSIIVGVAPILGGIIVLYLLFFLKIFPQKDIGTNALDIYLIFVISSTMFSSKQDLKDILYCIPIIILIGSILYIFYPSFQLILVSTFAISFTMIVKDISWYLFLSSCITIAILILLKVLIFIL